MKNHTERFTYPKGGLRDKKRKQCIKSQLTNTPQQENQHKIHLAKKVGLNTETGTRREPDARVLQTRTPKGFRDSEDQQDSYLPGKYSGV